VDKTILSSVTSLKEALVQGNPDEIAVMKSATLREALSHMLGQGLKSIPVIDEKGSLIGEVKMGDIEAATAETEG
jgi:CBS-domain-containing membrane protein